MDYINHWRTLNLDCRDRLFELFTVEMCIKGMYWDLLYILQGIKAQNFEQVTTELMTWNSLWQIRTLLQLSN